MVSRRLSTQDVLTNGPDRIRIGPWRGSTTVAQLTPMSPGGLLRPESVRRCLTELTARHYQEVVTAAVGPLEQEMLGESGFVVRERLHLLSRPLDVVTPPPPGSTRRARRSDRETVLAVDRAAFGPFWRLDDLGLDDALNATPSSRFRVNGGDDVVGYAISGRSGYSGYLQRLAVRPEAQRDGVGTALVLDALRWMVRRGATVAYVNTQVNNAGALALYERLRFSREPDGLAVMARPLGQ